MKPLPSPDSLAYSGITMNPHPTYMRRRISVALSFFCMITLSLFLWTDCSREKHSLRGQVIAGKPIPMSAMKSVMQTYNVPGASIAVIKSGQIDWKEGYGVCRYGSPESVDTSTLFQAASISKPVSAALALCLVERGLLSLDEDVNVKLTSLRVPVNELTRKDPITVRRLLSHSAGLSMHGVPEYSPGMPLPTLAEIFSGTGNPPNEPVQVVARPGSSYRYSGGGFILLQLLISDATHSEFEQLARELVLGPIGMNSSTFEQPLPASLHSRAAVGHDAVGKPLEGKWHTLPEQAAGGLWTTPSDLALFAIELRRSYQGVPDKFLSQGFAREMLTRHIDDFGLGWYLPSAGVFRFSHSGGNAGYRCFLVLSVESGDGIVIMTNGDSGESLINEVFRAIAAAYGWKA